MTQAPKIDRQKAQQDAVTILADSVIEVARAPFDGTVTSVTYTPIANVTGAASPASRSLVLVNRGQTGAGTTVVAQLDLVGGVNLTRGDEKVIPLSGTAANLVVASGDILEWQSTHVGGTGLVDPGGLVSVEITRS